MDVIFPEMQIVDMETSLQKRLKTRMDMMGLNAYQTAKKAGLGDSFVRDILRGKTKSPSSENIAKLAAALDTTPDWFIVDGEQDARPEALKPVALVGLSIMGKIQAGAWLDRSILDEDGDPEIIPVARDARFPRAKQYGLLIDGDSMDREYPDGTYVTCVDFYEAGVPLKDGLIVHVERHNGPLVEVTLKAVDTINGKRVLAPRSYNAKHMPIPIEGDNGSEIIIRGIVTGSYRRTVI